MRSIEYLGGRERSVTEARNWVTRASRSKFAIDQQVFSALATGPLSRVMLPGGAPEVFVGLELRRESACAEHDAWQRGVIPEGAPYPAGTMLAEISENDSLMFRPQLGVKNVSDEYDARDFFIEMYLPLLSSVQVSRDLSMNLAGRWSDYSTIGNTSSWMANIAWVVGNDLAIRGSVSRSVRAPNTTGLFGLRSVLIFDRLTPETQRRFKLSRQRTPSLVLTSSTTVSNTCPVSVSIRSMPMESTASVIRCPLHSEVL